MSDNAIVAWIVEHVLKLVELFVVVPIAIAAAILALVAKVLWGLVAAILSVAGIDVPPPPDALTAIVRWPYDALEHIFTGRGGFHWTPDL